MKDRNWTTGDAKREKKIYESDKVFDESMSSLIIWLKEAKRQDLLSQEDFDRIFQEELKARRDHDCTPQTRSKSASRS